MRVAPEDTHVIKDRIDRLKAQEAELHNLLTQSQPSLAGTSHVEAMLTAVAEEVAELELALASHQPQ